MKQLISGIMMVCVSMWAGALAADEKPVVEQTEKVAQKTNCIKQTGSRLKSKDKDGCNGLPGRSYDKEDIDRTGATTIAEALQRLDSSVQLGR